MHIGELARLTGKSVAALRYYEQVGLIPAPHRDTSGYRNYAPEIVERVRFIQRAKKHGFSLREIASILALYDRGQPPCEKVAKMARKKIAQLDRRIAHLQERRNMLADAVRLWRYGLLGDALYCPVLNVSKTEDGRPLTMARTIEVFTAGCPLCDETLKNVRDAVTPCGCNVVERSVDDAAARSYAITAVPTVVADGQVIFIGKLTPDQAVALLRR
ncbi:MAG TPA: MerR family DNA-binding protein [Chthonomonadales bacterium]|nr:MerR family DNA-binding protein [Chthonomonadales bacterium]